MIHMGDGMGFCFRACLDSRFTCELNYEREQCVPVERKVKCRHNSQPCESESPPAILFHSDDHILPWIMTLFSQILRSPFVMKSSTNQSKSFQFCSRQVTFSLPKFHLIGYFYQTSTVKTSRPKVDNNERWNKVVKTTVPIWARWLNKKMHENKINESKDTPRYQLLALGFPTYYFIDPKMSFSC